MKIPLGQSPDRTRAVCQIWWLLVQQTCKKREQTDRQTSDESYLLDIFLSLLLGLGLREGNDADQIRTPHNKENSRAEGEK